MTSKRIKHDPEAVDAYLASLLKKESRILKDLRDLIKKTVSNIEEKISYGTTVMFSLGCDLVGFVSQNNYLSFFTANPPLATKMRRATIHFSSENLLPDALVKKISKARARENQAKK